MLVERQTMKRFVVSAPWNIVVIGLFSLIALGAEAVTVSDLYEVTLPIEGNREAAFVEALRSVAVRVSGRRDAASRLGAAANSPRQYVQRFAFTTDDQLQVAFDSGSVDRLLSDSGLPLWSRERPATLVLLNIPTADGSSMWLDASYPAAERDALVRTAKLRGVPLVWPTLENQDRAALGSANASELMAIATRHNANAVLVGHGRRDANGIVVRWSLTSEDGIAEATGSLDEGAHLIADTFGRVFAAAAGSLGTVNIEVQGIDNLADYAVTLNYLEGMTLVRSVALEQVAGDRVRFQLGVRGDATTLRRALALEDKLVPASTDAAATSDRLQLRLSR
jgi:uncharacterized protein